MDGEHLLYQNQFVSTATDRHQDLPKRVVDIPYSTTAKELNSANPQRGSASYNDEESSKKKTKEYKTIINIDSRLRSTVAENIMSDSPTFLLDPLHFTENSNEVVVNHPNHGLMTENRIELLQVVPEYIDTPNNPVQTISSAPNTTVRISVDNLLENFQELSVEDTNPMIIEINGIEAPNGSITSMDFDNNTSQLTFNVEEAHRIPLQSRIRFLDWHVPSSQEFQVISTDTTSQPNTCTVSFSAPSKWVLQRYPTRLPYSTLMVNGTSFSNVSQINNDIILDDGSSYIEVTLEAPIMFKSNGDIYLSTIASIENDNTNSETIFMLNSETTLIQIGDSVTIKRGGSADKVGIISYLSGSVVKTNAIANIETPQIGSFCSLIHPGTTSSAVQVQRSIGYKISFAFNPDYSLISTYGSIAICTYLGLEMQVQEISRTDSTVTLKLTGNVFTLPKQNTQVILQCADGLFSDTCTVISIDSSDQITCSIPIIAKWISTSYAGYDIEKLNSAHDITNYNTNDNYIVLNLENVDLPEFNGGGNQVEVRISRNTICPSNPLQRNSANRMVRIQTRQHDMIHYPYNDEVVELSGVKMPQGNFTDASLVMNVTKIAIQIEQNKIDSVRSRLSTSSIYIVISGVTLRFKSNTVTVLEFPVDSVDQDGKIILDLDQEIDSAMISSDTPTWRDHNISNNAELSGSISSVELVETVSSKIKITIDASTIKYATVPNLHSIFREYDMIVFTEADFLVTNGGDEIQIEPSTRYQVYEVHTNFILVDFYVPLTYHAIQATSGKWQATTIMGLTSKTLNNQISLFVPPTLDNELIIDQQCWNRPYENSVLSFGGPSVTFRPLQLNWIMLNNLNRAAPSNKTHRSLYHRIKKIDDHNYMIIVDRTSNKTISGAGGYISIQNIEETNIGYSKPNEYEINLYRIFRNVVRVKMTSLEIPNSGFVVRDGINNQLHWQNLDDGDYIYALTIASGNYTVQSLANAVMGAFSDVERYYHSNLFHAVQIKVVLEQNRVELKSNEYFYLSNALSIMRGSKTVYVVMVDHGLLDGDVISLDQTSGLGNIPASELHKDHTIYVKNSSVFYFELTIKASMSLVKRGGGSIRIGKPIAFRLRLDQPNTLGAMLGFTIPGKEEAKPEYTTLVTNYSDDTTVPINLSGDTYILMTSDTLGEVIDTGGKSTLKNVFAKIQLGSTPGNVIFNSYIGADKSYEQTPIAVLDKIDIAFRDGANGNLVEFNNQNHSFTLEIVENIVE